MQPPRRADDERRDRVGRRRVERSRLDPRSTSLGSTTNGSRPASSRSRSSAIAEAPLLDAVACSSRVPEAPCARMSQPSSSAIQIDVRGEPIRSRRQPDDALVDLVEARGRRELAPELEQRRRALRLAARRLVEARVLDRDRGVAGEHLEQAHVVLVELVEPELRDRRSRRRRASRSAAARRASDSSIDGVPGNARAELAVRGVADQQRLAASPRSGR